jgi:hypothetical protein
MKSGFLHAFQLTLFLIQVSLLVSALGSLFYIVSQAFLEPDSFMLACSFAEMTVLIALVYQMLAWMRKKVLNALPTESVFVRLQLPSNLRVIHFAVLVIQIPLISGFSVFSAAIMASSNKGPVKVSDWDVFYDWLGYFACFLALYWVISNARSHLSYLSKPTRSLSNAQLPA